MVEDQNVAWRDGAIAEDSALRLVEDDLTAVQYAPHYDGGVWRCDSGSSWVEGTAQAAAALKGQGCTWSLHDVHVLPRGEHEAVATYRIVHTWGDAERRPAQAFFLETWRRGEDGRWRLARHTAEKV
jgi:ketosteroid isomerase-like protein